MKKICRRCGKTTNSRALIEILHFDISRENQVQATAFLCQSCQDEIFKKYCALANDMCPETENQHEAEE